MSPIIDLGIHSDDGPNWRLTPRTDAAKAWVKNQLHLPAWHWESHGWFVVEQPSFEDVIARARAAGLVLSFTAEHQPMHVGAN